MPRRTHISSILVIGAAALGWSAAAGSAQGTAGAAGQRLYAVLSDEVDFGGTYLRPSPDGDAVPDVDGNLAEDVMGCGFLDVRLLHDPSALHGAGFSLRLRESEMTASARTCLQDRLPGHARIIGPLTPAELAGQGL